MNTNGLTYLKKETSSSPVTIQSDQDILKNAPEGAWFIAYLYHRVVIGRIKNKQFVYYNQEEKDVILSKIVKIRIFNEDSELYVWKTGSQGYKARLRTDGKGMEQGIVEARQVLFGTEAKPAKDDSEYSVLTEKRGTEIILPLKQTGIQNNEINDRKGRICICTHSYIGFIEETGQATYEDVRFVKFQMYKEDEQ